MSILDIAPERPVNISPLAVECEADAEIHRQTKAIEIQSRDKSVGWAMKSIVATPDKQIMKNNRLALMMEIHQGRQPKQKQTEEGPVRRKETCACCGQEKALSMCSGELLCSSCAPLAGAVTKRPQDVAKMIISRGMSAQVLEAMGVLEVVSATVESEFMDKLKELVRYEGESGDELFAAIEKRVMISQDERDEFVSALSCVGEVCKAIGLRDDGSMQYKDVVVGVAQVSAALEAMERTPQEATMAYPQQPLPDTGPTVKPIDSHLLDLMLECPDVPRARIEAIREAAA